MNWKTLLPCLALSLGLGLGLGSPASAIEHDQAAVATPEKHATAVAVDVLRRGGNAVDAAVATAFVLAVSFPEAGNIGGGGFMTLLLDGESSFLDYRETAPAGADRDMYLDEDGSVLTDASLTGHRAMGVPGTVAGLWEAHQRYGELPWDTLVLPAVELASNGFIAEPWFVAVIDDSRERLAPTNFDDYYGDVQAGELFVQPELAKTLQTIAGKGRDGFYTGSVADLLVAEMERDGGLITREDLASYEPRWRDTLEGSWRGYEIISAPLPSSGGFAIIQFLSMRELMAEAFAGVAHNSAQYVHLKAELEKRIFADRARYLGDPDFVDFDITQLLDRDYLHTRVADISVTRPSPTEQVKAGLEGKHTTHFSIIDTQGNAVSNTYTLNTDFGSGVVVRGAGFLLNNEMDDFSAAPGQPNYYGVVGDEANAIAPGKRMLSSMSPTILTRDGEAAMILGAMGGSSIFTTVYQTIMNIVDFRMSAEQALAVPRVHHQLLPENLITFSPTTPLAEDTQDELRARGYTVQPHDWEFGNVQLIYVTEEGTVQAASDPRFSGRAEVVRIPREP